MNFRFSLFLTITIAIVFSVFTSAKAQIAVGNNFVGVAPGRFDPEKLQKLKNSTMIYVYRKTDNPEELEKIFKDNWTFCKYKLMNYPEFMIAKFDTATTSFFVINPENFVSHVSNSYSYYSNGSLHTHNSNTYTTLQYVYVYLYLYMFEFDNKGKPVKEPFARIDLTPDRSILTTIEVGEMFTKHQPREKTQKEKEHAAARREKERDVLYDLYMNTEIYNLNAGFLKNYLKIVNTALEENEPRSLYASYSNTEEMNKLKKEELQIPKYIFCFLNENKFESGSTGNGRKLMKHYRYNFDYISNDDLSARILTSEKAFYYMIFTRSSRGKFFNIFNSQTGEVIYCNYQPMSPGIKTKDINRIARSIRKQLQKQ